MLPPAGQTGRRHQPGTATIVCQLHGSTVYHSSLKTAPLPGSEAPPRSPSRQAQAPAVGGRGSTWWVPSRYTRRRVGAARVARGPDRKQSAGLGGPEPALFQNGYVAESANRCLRWGSAAVAGLQPRCNQQTAVGGRLNTEPSTGNRNARAERHPDLATASSTPPDPQPKAMAAQQATERGGWMLVVAVEGPVLKAIEIRPIRAAVAAFQALAEQDRHHHQPSQH